MPTSARPTETATSARAFAPAGVGNLGVGFDILGHTIEGPSDRALVRRIERPGVRIAAIRGRAPGLPHDAERNTAGRALIAFADALQLPFGLEIELDKGIALGSGLGGSAASAVAALVAANALLETPMPRAALYPFAREGEAAASGSDAGDNVGPMLLGGLVLATRERLIPLPVPAWLHCAAVHPDQVLETRRARAVLADPYALADFVRQSERLAQLLIGVTRGDTALIRAGLDDVLVEPRRAPLIPGFAAAKAAALAAGALGAGISGAGPTVFAWCDSRAAAHTAAAAMQAAFAQRGIAATPYVSPVAGPRAELLAD